MIPPPEIVLDDDDTETATPPPLPGSSSDTIREWTRCANGTVPEGMVVV